MKPTREELEEAIDIVVGCEITLHEACEYGDSRTAEPFQKLYKARTVLDSLLGRLFDPSLGAASEWDCG